MLNKKIRTMGRKKDIENVEKCKFTAILKWDEKSVYVQHKPTHVSGNSKFNGAGS